MLKLRSMVLQLVGAKTRITLALQRDFSGRAFDFSKYISFTFPPAWPAWLLPGEFSVVYKTQLSGGSSDAPDRDWQGRLFCPKALTVRFVLPGFCVGFLCRVFAVSA